MSWQAERGYLQPTAALVPQPSVPLAFVAAGAVVSTTSATSLSPAIPAGSYGLLFVHVQIAGASSAPNIDTPPGWTLLNDATAGSGAAFSRLAVFGRANPPAVSATFDYGTGSGRAQAVVLGYNGVNAASPIESAAVEQDIDNSVTTTSVPLTATTIPSIAIQAYGGRASGTTSVTATAGLGYTERVDSSQGSSFQFYTIVINDQTLAATGAVASAVESWSAGIQCISKSGFILK